MADEKTPPQKPSPQKPTPDLNQASEGSADPQTTPSRPGKASARQGEAGASQGGASKISPADESPLAAARAAAREAAIRDAMAEADRLAGNETSASEGGSEAEEAGKDTPQPAGEELTGEVYEAQIADLTDRLTRAHAEIQNLHRRLERDVAESAKYAITKFARDIVAVSDNFERALSAVSPQAASESPTTAGLLDGIKMTEREFQNVLERHKVQRIDPKGENFDPHRHQAMMEQEDPSVPAGTVLQVYQAGYVIDDRVLRPAMVVVAKGGAKPAKEPGSSTSAPPADEAVEPSSPQSDNRPSDPGDSSDNAA